MKSHAAKKILLDHVAMEILFGHNAITIYMALANHSQALNTSHFRQVMGTAQRHAFEAFVLSVCKLYEKPCELYPNNSIPTAIQLLQADSSYLDEGIQNYAPIEKFIQTRIDPAFAATCKSTLRQIPDIVLKHFAAEYPRIPVRGDKPLDKIFDALKVLRDKRVAHHENADLSSLSKTDLDGALELLAFAKTCVNLIGLGFFGFSTEGEVTGEDFAPSKSELWSQANRMITLLERS